MKRGRAQRTTAPQPRAGRKSTDLGASEQALLKSEQRLALVLAASSEGLWDWDIEHGDVTWSDRTFSMLGYDATHFGGTFDFVRELVHPSDREAFERALRDHLEGDKPFDFDLRMRRGDGSYGIFRTRGQTLRAADGRPVRMAGSIADVSEARRQARLLERAEAVARIGGFELDAESLRVYFSAEAYRLHDLDPERFTPTLESVLELYRGQAREQLQQALGAALERGQTFDLELALRTPSGRDAWLRVAGRAEIIAGRTVAVFGTLQDVTERRAAEDALRKSEQRFRGYFELPIVGLAITTPEKGLIEVNDHFCTQLGYPRAELLKKSWAELTHADDLAADTAHFNRVLAGRIDSYTLDKRFVRKDGSVLHAEISVRCVRRADKSVEYLLGLLHDVSERKEAERALRESSELFAKSFQEIPDPLMVSDILTGQLLDVNEGFERFFGCPRDEAIGRSAVELGFVTEQDRERLIAEALRNSGSVRDLQFSVRLRDGERRTTLISAESVEIGGRPRLIVLVRDITEQEKVQQALRESEERFFKAFRASPNAIGISELESGRLIEVNDTYERLSGRTREQLIGRTTTELGLWPEVNRERLAKRLLSEGSLRDLEIKTRNVRGEAIVAIVSVEVIEIKSQRCIIMTAQDITERRRIEAAKGRLEAELRHAQKMEAIGTLAGGIAHDFNNILGAMLAFTDLARMDAKGDSAVLDSLAEVRKAGDRAKELVRQILTFSRRHPQERRTVALQPVVKEVLSLVRSTLPATVEIAFEVSEQTGHVNADPSQIHQVLLNLCTNAAHAMRGKAGRVSIRYVPHALGAAGATGRGLAPGDYVELSVEDTGCGMDPETLKRIFEPFFTTKPPGEGTGLGLSVVHGIIQEHGGTIWVESELGRGTTFHVLLPACAPAGAARSDKPEDMPRGNGERVLYVDDEALLCTAGKRLLERLNYVVTAETNPRNALALFRADPNLFDLVVTDLTMPVLTGVELATELLLIRPGVPIVLLTGFSANLSAENVQALGIRQLAMKPLSASALARTLKAALQADAAA